MPGLASGGLAISDFDMNRRHPVARRLDDAAVGLLLPDPVALTLALARRLAQTQTLALSVMVVMMMAAVAAVVPRLAAAGAVAVDPDPDRRILRLLLVHPDPPELEFVVRRPKLAAAGAVAVDPDPDRRILRLLLVHPDPPELEFVVRRPKTGSARTVHHIAGRVRRRTINFHAHGSPIQERRLKQEARKGHWSLVRRDAGSLAVLRGVSGAPPQDGSPCVSSAAAAVQIGISGRHGPLTT
jgi:hypothetical protein